MPSTARTAADPGLPEDMDALRRDIYRANDMAGALAILTWDALNGGGPRATQAAWGVAEDLAEKLGALADKADEWKLRVKRAARKGLEA